MKRSLDESISVESDACLSKVPRHSLMSEEQKRIARRFEKAVWEAESPDVAPGIIARAMSMIHDEDDLAEEQHRPLLRGEYQLKNISDAEEIASTLDKESKMRRPLPVESKRAAGSAMMSRLVAEAKNQQKGGSYLKKGISYRLRVSEANIGPAVCFVLDHLLDNFVGRLPQDPIGLLRIFAKTWKNYDSTFDSANHNHEKNDFGRILSKILALKGSPQEGPEILARYVEFAIDCSNLGALQLQGMIVKCKKQDIDMEKYLDIASTIVEFCYAISPKSPIGIVILALMKLTPSRIGGMTHDERVIFIAIMAPMAGDEAGSRHRLVPQKLGAVVDVIVEGIIPSLEYTLAHSLRHAPYKMHSSFRRRFVFAQDGESIINFGINVFGKGFSSAPTSIIYKPSLQVVSGRPKFDRDTETCMELAHGDVQLHIGAHEEARWELPSIQTYLNIYIYQKYYNLDPCKATVSERVERYKGRIHKPTNIPDAYVDNVLSFLAFWAGCAPFDGSDKDKNGLENRFGTQMTENQRSSEIVRHERDPQAIRALVGMPLAKGIVLK